MSAPVEIINKADKVVGYIVFDGKEWSGYMSLHDAENGTYAVGIGTKSAAIRGIAQILAEMKAEQDFERRYA
jgi:hypothetical protein